MGRKRKGGDPFGLAGTRLAFRHNAFYYRHRETNRWERVGTDVEAAKERAQLYNDPDGRFGTLAYWIDIWLADCSQRVAAGALSQRTLDDYTADSVMLKAVLGNMLPEHLQPMHVQDYLDEGKRLQRATRANRERACLSSCFSWLIRKGKIEAKVNPCMRASGVKRNPEKKRDRYVTDEEYLAVYAQAPHSVRLAMELVYRTLQRPEVDVLAWTSADIRRKEGGRVLSFRQSKTGVLIEIAIEGRLAELVDQAIGNVTSLSKAAVQPILHTLKGEPYTYDGISAMLRRAQDKARKKAPAGSPVATMPPFGLRDLKGKGATDMWRNSTPIQEIQLLCGHADAKTTEIYIKARWQETARPNLRALSA